MCHTVVLKVSLGCSWFGHRSLDGWMNTGVAQGDDVDEDSDTDDDYDADAGDADDEDDDDDNDDGHYELILRK